MKVRYIINAWSGAGRAGNCKKQIEKWYLENKGFVPEIIECELEGQKSVLALAQEAAKEGIERVVAVGGDGTVNLIAEGFFKSSRHPDFFPEIGILPVGTANDFARNLQIPKNLSKALEIIEGGNVARIDGGKISYASGEKYFVNVASCFFDAEITKDARDMKLNGSRWPKMFHYAVSAVKRILKEPFKTYSLLLNGEEMHDVIMLVASNGKTYGKFFRIAPFANMQDGLLDVCVIKNVSGWKVFGYMFLLIAGWHTKLPEVEIKQISRLSITCHKDIPLEADGEVLPQSKEITIEVLHKKLKFLVPKEALEKVKTRAFNFF